MSTLHTTTKNVRNNEQTQFEDILYCFFDKVFDKYTEEKLAQHLPVFIREMAKAQIIGKQGFTNSVSRFLQLICQLAVDIPHICKIFAMCVMDTLIEVKMIDFTKIKWHDTPSVEGEEDDLADFKEVDAHYKVMAHLLNKYPEFTAADWLKANCPVLLSDEDSLKHVVDHASLITEIKEELELNEAAAAKLCGVLGLDKDRKSDF